MCSLEDLHEGSKKLMLLQVTALGNEFEVRVGIAAIATKFITKHENHPSLIGASASSWAPCFLYIWQNSQILLIPIHGSTSEALNHSGSPNYGKFTLSAKQPCQIHI